MGVVSFEGLIYIVGGCTTSSRHLPDLISYNPVTREWSSLASMNTARCQIGVAVLGRYIYVVGGNSSHQEVLRTVERYSFDDNVWEMLTSMSVPRASPAVVSADGLLYVAGGDQVSDSFYVFLRLLGKSFVDFAIKQGGKERFQCCDVIIKVS